MTIREILPMLMFAALLAGILVGFPVAFTIGGVAIIFGFIGYFLDIFHLTDFSMVPGKVFGVVSNVNLMAVPLFAFMGIMLEKSGVAKELLEAMGRLFRNVKGGLLLSVLLVGTVLAATTGIVGATVVTMGVIALPTMLKHHYNKELSCGIIAASGTLGQIIPPSIILVLLGDMMQVGIGDLFLGAILPGALLVTSYGVFIIALTTLKPNLAPKMPTMENGIEIANSLSKIFLALVAPIVLVFIVLGTIMFGIATPTEAASCGAVGTIFITLAKRKFTWHALKDSCYETTKLSAMVFTILIGAQFFGVVFRGIEGEILVTEFVNHMNFSGPIVILILMAIMFLLGFFLDFLEICFIVIPIMYPLFLAFKIDLLWLSILMALNLQTSFLTPPFGFALFYLKGSAPKEIKTSHIYKGVIPFICIQALVVAIVYCFPALATWLPHQFNKPKANHTTMLLKEKSETDKTSYFKK
jgi:tripartite ATP-independent transporter DctM subunit